MDYKKTGVDIEAGDSLVDWLRKTQPAQFPHQDKLVEGIGGFAALFKADFKNYKEPCLVTCTDGVGTKVKLASQAKKYGGVAQDLVAMCLNDLICCGAEPWFFLDYYASGKLDLEAAKEFLSGVRQACHSSNCALIGGETAEMPGMYENGDFDCAGFAVGVVDRSLALGSHRVQDGDIILGLASSGCHSNGYSLLRQVFAEDLTKWMEQLLTPTRLYVDLVKKLKEVGGVKAIAHITGGGLDNVTRVLPAGAQANLQPSWVIPEVFREVKRRTQMSWSQMLTTLNCGLGLVLVVDPKKSQELLQVANNNSCPGYIIGRVTMNSEKNQNLTCLDKATWNLATDQFDK
ncbi:MAG: phosphoribosylformylglycinamidine cyclo-ligase [Bdellovibrionales bacterium]|nr:phosphoribosylformylglycinamidine cyclo-ligase [Bdellovibrionales bacterium]